jgi:ribosome biogenesis GTPase A
MAGNKTGLLRQYIRTKQEVVDLIRSGKNVLDGLGLPEMEGQFQALLVKLAEDRFNLAVVGQFKRGKSSLMNAIIGRDLLPTGYLPLTSAITTLCYGPEERVVLRRKGWALEQEIDIDELAEYVTERGNPDNEKGLIEARVEMPVPFLRRGLYFIDTPGIGSANQAATATTYQFLPDADAVILVTSVEAPMSSVEESLLRDIRKDVRKLFIVVNKIDLLDEANLAPVIDYIRLIFAQNLETEALRLFPVSSRLGLQAKQGHAMDLLSESGLEAFENELSRFLAEDKSRLFLVSILDRALEILAAGPSDPVSVGRDGNAKERFGELLAIRSRMQSLRTALLQGELLPDIQNEGEPTRVEAVSPTHLIDHAIAEQKTRAESNREQLVRPIRTCPICEAQSQAAFDFFARWQYALAKDPAARSEFALARGFCHVHTWQFQQIASPRGISEGYAPLIERVKDELNRLRGKPSADMPDRVRALLSGPDSCPACQLLKKVEGERIRQFIKQIALAETQERYARTQGLCLPHLCAALEAQPEPEIARFLLDEQARRFEEISEDMHGYVLKRDAIRRGLLNANEEDAWRRALILLSGERTARVI